MCSFPYHLLRQTLFAYKPAGLVYLPSATGREVSTSTVENALFPGSGQPGDAVRAADCKGDSRGAQCLLLLLSLDPPPGDLAAQWCHCLGDPEQGCRHKTPLAGGEERRGGGGGKGDRCPDRWAWPPALPGLMNFLLRPSGRSVNETSNSIWDDSRMRLINQA